MDETRTQQGWRIKCPRCGYEWTTKVTKPYIMCPACRRFFKNPLSRYWGEAK